MYFYAHNKFYADENTDCTKANHAYSKPKFYAVLSKGEPKACQMRIAFLVHTT